MCLRDVRPRARMSLSAHLSSCGHNSHDNSVAHVVRRPSSLFPFSTDLRHKMKASKQATQQQTTMARAPHRHNGRRRRRATRRTPLRYRNHALPAGGVSLLRTYQLLWSISVRGILNWTILLVVMLILTRHDVDDDIIGDFLEGEQMGEEDGMFWPSAAYSIAALLAYHRLVDHWSRQDEALADVPFWEEVRMGPSFEPIRHRYISDCTDTWLRICTRFNKEQVQRLYNLFGLPRIVRVPTVNNHGYLFGGEELFLFSLTKIATGLDNTRLCEGFFGGDARRWSYGYPWFLRYTEQRCGHLLDRNSLHRWIGEFPRFAAAIEKKISTASVWTNPLTGVQRVVPGLRYPVGNFNVFGFMDCSIFETETPGTGPVGDWVDAPRRPNACDIQRSVYTRHKKLHGIKALTIVMPNGISVVWGPVSTRRADSRLQELSGLNNYLLQMQQGRFPNGKIYCVYTDKGFTAMPCVRQAYRAAPGAPLTPLQILQNFRMKCVRITVEWSYGLVSNVFRICRTFSDWKLHCEHPYCHEQLRASFLLANCCSCFNHNQISSIGTFGLSPPPVEHCLQ